MQDDSQIFERNNNYGLFYTPRREMKIKDFTDAYWRVDKDDREST